MERFPVAVVRSCQVPPLASVELTTLLPCPTATKTPLPNATPRSARVVPEAWSCQASPQVVVIVCSVPESAASSQTEPLYVAACVEPELGPHLVHEVPSDEVAGASSSPRSRNRPPPEASPRDENGADNADVQVMPSGEV